MALWRENVCQTDFLSPTNKLEEWCGGANRVKQFTWVLTVGVGTAALGLEWDFAGERQDSHVRRTYDARQTAWMTHWERLLPAGSHYGRSDDGHVEVTGLLLHQVLSQGFGVGVGVGTLANQFGSQKRDQLFIHPAGRGKKKNQSIIDESEATHLLIQQWLIAICAHNLPA